LLRREIKRMNKKRILEISVLSMLATILLGTIYMANAATYTSTGTDPITYPECRIYLTVETDPNKDCITVNSQWSWIIITPLPFGLGGGQYWEVWDDKGFSASGTGNLGQMMYYNDNTWVHAHFHVTYILGWSFYTTTAQADVYVGS
jgi:hypothetical protein